MDGSEHDSAAPAPYKVLARKYRPARFADLIGQEPMVRTLTNAFKTGRIAQAYMLTGVRGVGKTTTARILARALNYSIPGKVDQPSIELDELGEHCTAIMEGRHVDVIEMDAASHTGIDDIREIIEASRYRPSVARFKVYIIDEVHMLSKAAFNGLLKTLEEPPAHVKFIFATTEIRKVPVTVLSRCQRFDLRRIEAGRLVALMQTIVASEGITVDDQAMRMVARAAEGSARDALSLLDQAIAHAAGTVEADTVASMLGLADRAAVIDLYEEVMSGKIEAALERLKALYNVGADPVVVLEDLAAFTHLVTRLKLAPGAGEDETLSEAERDRGKEFAEKISLRALTRAWQMLLKGIDEVRESSRPLAAADMVLVRLAYAADLPTPDEALKALKEGGGTRGESPPARSASPNGSARMTAGGAALQTAPAPVTAPTPVPEVPQQNAPRLASLADLIALAGRERDLKLKHALETFVRPISFSEGRIEIALTEHAAADLVGELSRKLEDWTGRRWMIAVARDGGAETVEEQRRSAREQLVSDARADPVVAAVLAQFPGAEIVDVRVHADDTGPMATDMAPLTDPDETLDEDD